MWLFLIYIVSLIVIGVNMINIGLKIVWESFENIKRTHKNKK